MGQKGPSAYIFHPSASILYPSDYIFVVLNVILEHFGRPLALLGILWCPYGPFGLHNCCIYWFFALLVPLWYPYDTIILIFYAF